MTLWNFNSQNKLTLKNFRCTIFAKVQNIINSNSLYLKSVKKDEQWPIVFSKLDITSLCHNRTRGVFTLKKPSLKDYTLYLSKTVTRWGQRSPHFRLMVRILYGTGNWVRLKITFYFGERPSSSASETSTTGANTAQPSPEVHQQKPGVQLQKEKNYLGWWSTSRLRQCGGKGILIFLGTLYPKRVVSVTVTWTFKRFFNSCRD